MNVLNFDDLKVTTNFNIKTKQNKKYNTWEKNSWEFCYVIYKGFKISMT